MNFIEPQVFPVGETGIINYGMDSMLKALGVPDWDTDAESEAEYLTEAAGKLCYKSFSTDLNENLTRTGTRSNYDYIQQQLIATKHGSVLEHCVSNFVFLDVSRVLTHELVRHGDGTAFSQESGRYVRATEISIWVPSIIKNHSPELYQEFVETLQLIENQYRKLVQLSGIRDSKDFGWKKEMTSALRRTLPEGRSNAIFFSANHRALRHIIEMRTSRHAEEEIRIVFNKVFNWVEGMHPAIYGDFIKEEIKGIPEIRFAHSKV